LGMSGEVTVEARMSRQKLGIVRQTRIGCELLRYFRMLIEIATVEATNRARRVRPVAIKIVAPLIAHEAVRMGLQLLADLGMASQVAVEPGVGGKKLRIVSEPWISRQLTGYFGMLVQVAVVESCNRPGGRARRCRDRTSSMRPLVVSLAIHELAGG